jgi:hypothetical protein
MKYALLVYSDPRSWDSLSESEQHEAFNEYMAVGEAPGMVGDEQLQGVETATTVRVENGETLTTDGPFADSKEVFGGFYLLEADDIDTAIQLAARIPAARMGGGVEVRPVVEH